MDKTFSRIQEFIRLETSGGVVLMIAAIFAMIIANTSLSATYDLILSTYIKVEIGNFEIAKPAILWINDGLMAIFFFLVGLEIKREVLAGELSSFDKAILPIMAAIGGMAVPGIIFAIVNWGTPENLNGWAIPTATDIAFALGILALIGSRAPIALKIFLLAIAIIDDLGAIVIIAIFYTSELSINALSISMIGFAAAIALNRLGIQRTAPYLLVGIIVWVFVLKSGIHATLAGVLIAFTIPLKTKNEDEALLYKMEHGLHPWVAFLILPVFAFANAGVNFTSIGIDDLLQPLTLGIAVGLFLGKQIGVFLATWIGVKSGIARLPENVSWKHVYGVACLTGVGFTMSLFIGSLAFTTADVMNSVRLGVVLGSVLSGIIGYLLLKSAAHHSAQ